MTVLQWSERARLATTAQQRLRLKRLFDALLRNHPEGGAPYILLLDLPGEEDLHYRFVAERRGAVWRVDAKVRRPDLGIRFRDAIWL